MVMKMRMITVVMVIIKTEREITRRVVHVLFRFINFSPSHQHPTEIRQMNSTVWGGFAQRVCEVSGETHTRVHANAQARAHTQRGREFTGRKIDDVSFGGACGQSRAWSDRMKRDIHAQSNADM